MTAVGVNTSRAAGPRALRFSSLAEVHADVDRIEAASREGRLRTSGNWTSGQVLGHVAAWMSYPYDGFPLRRAPWIVRAIVGMRKSRYLDRAMPRGVRIPGVKGGTVGIEDMTVEEGASRLLRAIARLERDRSPAHESPLFGPLTHDEWVRLNLRHAELHLSHLRPD